MSRSWAKSQPKSKASRQALRDRCGPSSFLAPKALKYPVVPASGTCKVDCGGVRAAHKRGAQQHRPAIAAAALRLGRRLGCPWAKGVK